MNCTLFAGNSNLIELKGLKNQATGSFENGAAVSVTLKDESEVEIVGETWPLTMNYVSASNGDYRATLVEGLPLTHGQYVTAFVTAVVSGLTGKWEIPCKVIERN